MSCHVGQNVSKRYKLPEARKRLQSSVTVESAQRLVPLLHTPSEAGTQYTAGMSSDEHLVSGHFVYDDRPRHDVFWGLLYAGALAITTVGGIYSAAHRCVQS